jgi:hypothetical protein
MKERGCWASGQTLGEHRDRKTHVKWFDDNGFDKPFPKLKTHIAFFAHWC